MLLLLGGMATLAATTCSVYGMSACRDDRDCKGYWDAAYCNQKTGLCEYTRDASTTPAPEGPDAGQQ